MRFMMKPRRLLDLCHINGGSCHKYHFSGQNRSFVATKVCLSRQSFCRYKLTFVATNTCMTKLVATKIGLFCRDKHNFTVKGQKLSATLRASFKF